MLKKVKKTTDKKTTTVKPKKVVVTKKVVPKAESPKPKSKADLLREKIELKRAEHGKAASKGPRTAELYRQELIALEKELSELV
tara:strand:- start:76 stop:327 length:252 start_codon:yes stop_codon:yes gene_type:complete